MYTKLGNCIWCCERNRWGRRVKLEVKWTLVIAVVVGEFFLSVHRYWHQMLVCVTSIAFRVCWHKTLVCFGSVRIWIYIAMNRLKIKYWFLSGNGLGRNILLILSWLKRICVEPIRRKHLRSMLWILNRTASGLCRRCKRNNTCHLHCCAPLCIDTS